MAHALHAHMVAAVLLGLSTAGPALAAEPATADWSRYVNPFIGTAGHGHTYPGATLPFGMVQLSPDTRLSGWDGCSGYHWSDDVIYGFSHTHLSGTGVSDYGDILFMPFTGAIRFHNGNPTAAAGDTVVATAVPGGARPAGAPTSGYASHFDKSSERAEPGWYAVRLTDAAVAVELTATERTGMHRYRFPADTPGHVIVDLAHRDPVLESGLRVVSPTGIEGWRRSSAWAKDQIVYFAARFSRPFTAVTFAQDGRRTDALNEVEGTNVQGVFSFGDAGGELLVKVGLSAVDVAGAWANLDAELPGWHFEGVRYAARTRWNDALGRLEIKGGTEAQCTIFYTALYHSLMAPNVFSDVDGRYRGMDGDIHQAGARRHYTVFSLWDTFRAAHPLYTLAAPERVGEFIQTFLAQAAQGGRLPVWELAANETDCMIGYHAVSVITDAWRKGWRDFDAAATLDAMVHSAKLDHFGLDAYKRQGFIGSDDAPESVSRTLEYAYDDWCIAQFAADIGRDDVARTFWRRSQAWRHLFDPETRFLRPRRHQIWQSPFDPRQVDVNYTEANAWQYSFFVPHDVHGLMETMGGADFFVARLDSLFEADSLTTGRDQADITGRIGQYAHGNEPSHHMAWLYHYAGRPDKSAGRVRQILDTLYGPGADGLCGNEDCGQMSSWYVLAAIGLYPVCPGSNEYLIGAPLFEEVVLHLPEDRRFVIRAENARHGAMFVGRARLNGRPLERSYLLHDEIRRGRGLTLELTDTPSSAWGRARAHRPDPIGALQVASPAPDRAASGDDRERPPRTASAAAPQPLPQAAVVVFADERVLPAPFVRAVADEFADSVVVALGCAETGADVFYQRLDPAAPAAGARIGKQWQRYLQPIELRQSTRLRVVAEHGDRRSPEVEATFHRRPNRWSVQVEHDPNPQYTAGGPLGLVNGRRGANDWRLGGWHGIQGEDFVATVDLGAVQPLARVGAGFLQDVGSWIWMPTELVVSVSQDGKRYRRVARLQHDVAADRYGIERRDLETKLTKVQARFVRFEARTLGAIPAWHPGHGSQAFLFVDELFIE